MPRHNSKARQRRLPQPCEKTSYRPEAEAASALGEMTYLYDRPEWARQPRSCYCCLPAPDGT